MDQESLTDLESEPDALNSIGNSNFLFQNSHLTCNFFLSYSQYHQMRHIVVAVAAGDNILYAWDYTKKNFWEACKYKS